MPLPVARLAARLVLSTLLLARQGLAQGAEDPGNLAARDRFLGTQSTAMGVLGGWAAVSVGTGAGLWALGRTPFVRAVGVQQVAWGAIDGAIAAFSYRGILRDRGRIEPAAYWEQERRKLRTILAVNMALDLVYVAVGAALWRWGKSEQVRGAGAGVIPQGAFLLAFDSAFLFSL